MVEISALGLASSFAAGVISFLSPCVLPLVPAYVSYVGGESLRGMQTETRAHFSAAALSVFFILGFSAIFIAVARDLRHGHRRHPVLGHQRRSSV